jgi:hypothetical protein
VVDGGGISNVEQEFLGFSAYDAVQLSALSLNPYYQFSSAFAAPNNGPTWSQKNKTCLNTINNTPDGKFYNTFSYASPLFSLDDAATEGAKRGAKSFLKAGAKNWGRTALGSGSGFLAGAWDAVDYALAPLSAAATAGQLTVHAGCAIAAAF